MRLDKKFTLLVIAFITIVAMATTIFAETLSLSPGYVATKVNANITVYGKHYFHNGLMSVMSNDAKGNQWMYLNTNGELVDLGEKSYGFDFSEGLAPFIDINDKIGYMNTTGMVVIPAQYDIFDAQGRFFSGRFINGNALVFKSTGINKYGISEGQWIQIDQNGQQVEKTLEERRAGVVYSNASGYFEGVSTETVIIDSGQYKVDFSEGSSLVDVGKQGNYYVITKTSSEISDDTTANHHIIASYTNTNVLVNGVPVEFEAYNINGHNYFKLRDIAKAMSGSEKQFEVTWDKINRQTSLLSGNPYTEVGGELAKGDGTDKVAIEYQNRFTKDGKIVEMQAYTINDNNFFKLRDLCQIFNISVNWDEAINSIIIDTSKLYVSAAE